MKKYLINFYNSIVGLLVRPIFWIEQYKHPSPKVNERPVEYAYALKQLLKAPGRKVLDVGVGKSAFSNVLYYCGYEVTAIDKMDNYWDNFYNRHYPVNKDDIVNTKLEGPYDAILCISTLEHIEHHNIALKNMYKLLGPNGLLILTFPYNEVISFDNIYDHPDAGYGKNANFITKIFNKNSLRLASTNSCIIDDEYYKIFNGKFWTMGGRCIPEKVSKNDLHHLLCITIKKKN